jgi:hypothetical protein
MLRQYEQMDALRAWLRKRITRNLPLPSTMEETTVMLQDDNTGFPTKTMR